MSQEALDIYLVDITSLEPRPVAVNIVPKEPSDEEDEDEDTPLGGNSTLDKLKAESADPDSPFAKKPKRVKKKKGIKGTNDNDPEFDDMLKELGMDDFKTI